MGGSNSFFIRRPGGTHTRFSIIKRENGKNETIANEALDAINAEFLSGKMPIDEALEAVKREMKRLKGSSKPIGKVINLSGFNVRLLERYWKEAYEHRDVIDSKSAYNRLRRVIDRLGETPLTASRLEIQKAISKYPPKQQRECATVIAQFLKFMNRGDVILQKSKKPRNKVSYVTLEEFRKIINHIEKEYKPLFWAAFSCGARIGELFSLELGKYRNGEILIDDQMDRNLVIRDTKNRRSRRVAVIKDIEKHFIEWLNYENKASIRNMRFSDMLKDACKISGVNKTITFHDLRHSYAIYLLNKGISLSLVAQSLGDSEAVAREHYVGFDLTEEGLSHIKKAIS